MPNDGFDNENKIIRHINGKRFSQINKNMQNFLQFSLEREIMPDELVACRKDMAGGKSDILVTVGEDEFRASVKKGTGNSVHQESIEVFVDYIAKELHADKEIQNAARFYIWGDKTLNGSGKKSDRMSSTQIKNKHPDVVGKLRKFFNQHKRALIERFLVKGLVNSNFPNVVYYGDEKSGVWARFLDVVDFLESKETSDARIAVGGLTFQAWNRALKKDSKKRGVVQSKWPSLEEDLKELERKHEQRNK